MDAVMLPPCLVQWLTSRSLWRRRAGPVTPIQRAPSHRGRQGDGESHAPTRRRSAWLSPFALIRDEHPLDRRDPACGGTTTTALVQTLAHRGCCGARRRPGHVRSNGSLLRSRAMCYVLRPPRRRCLCSAPAPAMIVMHVFEPPSRFPHRSTGRDRGVELQGETPRSTERPVQLECPSAKRARYLRHRPRALTRPLWRSRYGRPRERSWLDRAPPARRFLCAVATHSNQSWCLSLQRDDRGSLGWSRTQ